MADRKQGAGCSSGSSAAVHKAYWLLLNSGMWKSSREKNGAMCEF